MLYAIFLDGDLGRLNDRIVGTDDFDESTIAGGAMLGSNDSVERALLGAHAAQTKFNHYEFSNGAEIGIYIRVITIGCQLRS